LNVALLLGTVERIEEPHYTQGSGTCILRMKVKTTTEAEGPGGEMRERTDFHAVVFFGKYAEGLARNLQPGREVFITGEVRPSSYEDRSGNKRHKVEIHGKTLRFC